VWRAGETGRATRASRQPGERKCRRCKGCDRQATGKLTGTSERGLFTRGRITRSQTWPSTNKSFIDLVGDIKAQSSNHGCFQGVHGTDTSWLDGRVSLREQAQCRSYRAWPWLAMALRAGACLVATLVPTYALLLTSTSASPDGCSACRRRLAVVAHVLIHLSCFLSLRLASTSTLS
jgi:hypothetical protein